MGYKSLNAVVSIGRAKPVLPRIKHRLLMSITVISLFFSLAVTSYAETTNYFYDNLNRLIRVEYGDGTAIEYTYDGAGNRLTKSISETVPPVTTASPRGGTYSSGQSVMLTCNDGTGSGCDKIYYTTDGTTPTTLSPLYSSPINFSVSTTLKFFAKDLAGNSESVKTEIYAIGDLTPPTPNPMAWATEPYETSASSISMVATAASDPTTPISYFFKFYGSPTGGGGGTSSAWQSSRSYTDSGLSPNHQYGYRVKARDGKYNETGFSPVSYDYTDIETPSGITFGAVTNNNIEARSTNTPSGLTRGSSGLIVYNVTKGTNSGWKQDNNYWTSGSLSVNTRYAFRAKARNGDADETPYSGTVYRYTSANAPGVAAFSNITPVSVQANWTANGNPVGTKYYCKNTTKGTNSGWITNTYWNSTGLTCGSYSFRVKAKNGDAVETPWTVSGSISPICGPDLTETSVSNPPSAVILGGAFQVTDTVKNQGSLASGPSVTQYYLSTDTAKGSTDKLLTGSRSVPGLAVGGTSTGTVTVAVPSATPLGTYYLLACADDTNGVTETNESNNCKASGTKIQINP